MHSQKPKNNVSPLVVPSKSVCQTHDLCFTVDGKELLSNINLTLKDSGITMVMGPNGSGKSLLLRLLHGMLKPSSGNIIWNNHPIDENTRQQQAMVFQRPTLLRRSVAANIRFAMKMRKQKKGMSVEDALEAVGLQHQAKQPARLLSGGEQQRLSLARALVLEPKVLFLDEPTASLDPAATAAIETIVRTTHEHGTKIIFVSHDPGQAKRLADDIIFLQHGKLAEHSSADIFFNTPKSQAAEDYLAGRLVLKENL